MANLKVGDVVQITGSDDLETAWIGLKATIKSVYSSSYLLAPHTPRPDGHKLIEFLWNKKHVELTKPEPAVEEFKVGDIVEITKVKYDDMSYWIGYQLEVVGLEGSWNEKNLRVKAIGPRPDGVASMKPFDWSKDLLKLVESTPKSTDKTDHDLLEEIAAIIHGGGAGLVRLVKIDQLLKGAGIEVKS